VTRERLWYVAKGLEGLGMVLVLVGLLLSMRLGMQDDSLGSMSHEMIGLMAGGGLFVLGWALERWLGTR